MNKLMTLILFVSLSAQASFTEMLELDFSRKYNISGVPVATSAVYKGTKLTLSGTGTAFKKYGVSKAKIFMMQYFTQYPKNLVRDSKNVLNSIPSVGETAIRITFMRNIDSATISETLSSYIVDNIGKVDLPKYQSDIDVITKAISSDSSFVVGDSITMFAFKNVIIYENAKKQVHVVESKNEDMATRVFSMFMGTPTDSEGYSLKAQLLQNPRDVFGEEIITLE